jgi:hypothetical protein
VGSRHYPTQQRDTIDIEGAQLQTLLLIFSLASEEQRFLIIEGQCHQTEEQKYHVFLKYLFIAVGGATTLFSLFESGHGKAYISSRPV